MNLVGLDLNATRARAVHGAPGAPPRPLALDGNHGDLPVAVSLEGRHPEAGRAALALCRRLPHVACLDLLAHLGQRKEWHHGKHRLDAARALGLVFARLQPALSGAKGLALALPAYLGPSQVSLLVPLVEKTRVPVLASVSAPLAAALAAYREHPAEGLALVLDVDDHALTVTAVAADDERARVLADRSLPSLNLRAWKECLLDAVADRCVRHSRRDPRDSAPAEQSLYEQLDAALDAWRQGQMVELVIRAAPWFQNLILRPEEIVQFSARLARQALEGVRAVAAAVSPDVPRRVLVTEAAGRLPGLVPALQTHLGEPAAILRPDAAAGEPAHVLVLQPDALGRAAHELALRVQHGDLARGHLDTVVPLPSSQPVDAGPARLHFRGHDYPLRGRTFTLGRQPGCDLVFDSEQYAGVSGRHCEIVLEHRSYVLRDRSRNGTLVNDRPVAQQVTLRPGDWIRLGPDGPLLRFLGEGEEQNKLGTTA